MAGLRKKQIDVDCSNCSETFSVNFVGKSVVIFCCFCGEEVSLIDDNASGGSNKYNDEDDDEDDEDNDECDYWIDGDDDKDDDDDYDL